MNEDISGFYGNIGYVFRDESLISEALTHSSYANERGHGDKIRCNERLEFFGDSILSLLCSEYLFVTYPDLPEGDLTKIRASVVCEDALSVFSKQIGVGDYIMLGKGEEQNNGKERKSILADAFEAILAAVYLDGGRGAAEAFLYPLLIPQIHTRVGVTNDYKSLLQQFIQETPGEAPEYELTGEEGPSHDKTFFVAVKLDGNTIGKGQGKSKRAAEQQAAFDALVLFGVLQK